MKCTPMKRQQKLIFMMVLTGTVFLAEIVVGFLTSILFYFLFHFLFICFQFHSIPFFFFFFSHSSLMFIHSIKKKKDSIALIADSFHMLSDLLALIVAIYAIRLAKKSEATKENSYGFQRAEILGALVNGVFLLALCFTIFLDALQRFFDVPGYFPFVFPSFFIFLFFSIFQFSSFVFPFVF